MPAGDAGAAIGTDELFLRATAKEESQTDGGDTGERDCRSAFRYGSRSYSVAAYSHGCVEACGKEKRGQPGHGGEEFCFHHRRVTRIVPRINGRVRRLIANRR